MRTRLLFIPLAVVTALALVAAACGGDSDSGDVERAADEGPQSLGSMAADIFLTFDGQRYRLMVTRQAGLIDDEFTEIGVATDADIDFEGELLVFSREGDDQAVYTFSPTEDLRVDDGEPGQVIAEEPSGQATDSGEGPVVGTGSGSASGDDVAADSGEGRTIVHERPQEEPAEVVDAEEGVFSGLWLRWEIE